MQAYVIKIDTIPKLKANVYLLENYNFDGIVKVNYTYIEPEDLLLLFGSASFEHVVLQICTRTSGELEHITEYLKKTGLLPAEKRIA